MKEKIQQMIRYHAIKQWYERYERLLMPATLVLGSVLDFVTFVNITIVTTFLLLGVYLLLATGGILFIILFDAGRIPVGRITKYSRLVSPLVVQFTFGALLSGTMVFYFFSGAVSVSWPVIAIFVVLMIANEVFREYYVRPLVQLGVYFFIILSFFSVLLPFVFHTIAAWSFVAASVVSVLWMYVFVGGIASVAPIVKRTARPLAVVVVCIVLAAQGAYFSHSIPPVPLALRDTAVAHSLIRRNQGYEIRVEKTLWWKKFFGRTIVHVQPGERVYVYTAIFAPKDLNTTAVHHWQYYDEATKRWLSRDRLTYTMIGGNTVGYHGYSYKTTLVPGLWRVDVETVNEQVIGRVLFRVERPEEPLVLETQMRW